MKTINKKLVLVFTGIVAICAMVISMTSAYFTSSKTISGSITAGVVNIHLRSSTTDKCGNTTVLNKTALPGSTILTTLNIYSSTITVPVLLRITMLMPKALHDNLTVTSAASLPGSNWHLCNNSDASSTDSVTISSTAYVRYEWYYGSTLSAMTAVAASTISATAGMSIFGTTANMIINTSATSISSATLYIAVDAIQSTNATLTPTWFRSQIASRTALTALGD